MAILIVSIFSLRHSTQLARYPANISHKWSTDAAAGSYTPGMIVARELIYVFCVRTLPVLFMALTLARSNAYSPARTATLAAEAVFFSLLTCYLGIVLVLAGNAPAFAIAIADIYQGLVSMWLGAIFRFEQPWVGRGISFVLPGYIFYETVVLEHPWRWYNYTALATATLLVSAVYAARRALVAERRRASSACTRSPSATRPASSRTPHTRTPPQP